MEQEGPVVYPNANVLERDAMGRGTMQPLPPPSNSEFGRWADLSRDPGYSRPQYDERYYDVGAYDYGSYEEQDGPSTSQYSSEGRGDFYEDTKAYGPGSGSRTWQDDLTTPKRPSAPGNSKGVARRVDVEVLDDWDA